MYCVTSYEVGTANNPTYLAPVFLTSKCFLIISLCVYYVASSLYCRVFHDQLDSVYGQTTKPVGPQTHVQHMNITLYTIHTYIQHT